MDDAATLRPQQSTNDQLRRSSREGHAENAVQKSSFPGIILSKLTNSRQHKPALGSQFPEEECGEEDATEQAGISGDALASALHQQRKMRRRKGSLRKTALLGNGVMRLESKATRGHASRATAVPSDDDNGDAGTETLDHSGIGVSHVDGDATQPSFHDQLANASPRPPTPPDRPLPSLSQQQTQPVAPQQLVPPTMPENLPNPTEAEGETDNPELVSLRPLLDMSYPTSQSRTSSGDSSAPSLPVPPPRIHSKHTPSSSSDSYAPSQAHGGSTLASSVRASSQRITSPLATNSAEIAIDPEGWDYSETEWWGWIILIVTWLVFVVGMGSCLGVWSWAWDVGETPYAPPELEDDPTLPIVGYYPALMTLTAVMAWVWVVIAWVGMKYFRHAKISGEDL